MYTLTTPSQSFVQNNIVGYQGQTRKILIVDDNEENRSVLVNLLEPLGFELLEANNGRDGLDKAVRWQPDALVTDLSMPVMDGYEMLQTLRSFPQYQKIAAIASSASVFGRDRQKSLDAGANYFLPKPIEIESLLAVLKQYLELEWIYELDREDKKKETNNVINLNATEIMIPSTEDMTILQDLSRKGLINDLLKELDRLEELDEQLTPFTQKLRQFATNYKLRELRQAIEQYLS
jgi:CheY-like chemotaxis protein